MRMHHVLAAALRELQEIGKVVEPRWLAYPAGAYVRAVFAHEGRAVESTIPGNAP